MLRSGPPLARALARHAITVDVLAPSFIAGFGHKPVLGFAAGGFVLMNRQARLRRYFRR